MLSADKLVGPTHEVDLTGRRFGPVTVVGCQRAVRGAYAWLCAVDGHRVPVYCSTHKLHELGGEHHALVARR